MGAGGPRFCGTPEGGIRLTYRDGIGAGKFSLDAGKQLKHTYGKLVNNKVSRGEARP